MSARLKLLFVVAESTAHINLPAKNLIHTDCTSRIFPVIHEHKPDAILLDHDFLGNEVEKILRRFRSNQFYRGIKIYCYKSKPHTKVDDLLKVLGVQYFIYAPQQKPTTIAAKPKSLSSILKNVSPAKFALRLIH